MEHSNRGIIGIELSLLEEIIRTIVRQEMVETREEIKQTLISKQELLLQEERLTIEQVRVLLRKKSRHTIGNYIKSGVLPEPKRDLSGHPYWTPDQLERAIRHCGIKASYPT